MFVILGSKASETQRIIGLILRNEVRKEDESILCIVNAHGVSHRTHFIFDSEREKLPVVSGILKPVADCPELTGKPKVFVINACRVKLETEILDESGVAVVLEENPDDLVGLHDCLIMYSSQLYTKSWRQESGFTKGTLCLLELVTYVTLLHATTDVEDIFEKVKMKVPELAEEVKRLLLDVRAKTLDELANQLADAQRDEDTEIQAQELRDDFEMQTKYFEELKLAEQHPEIYSSLTKRLSWRPR